LGGAFAVSLEYSLGNGGAYSASDVTEGVVDVASDGVHSNDRSQSDQGGEECVFNQILAGLVPVKAG
jgi:hypothetical protein